MFSDRGGMKFFILLILIGFQHAQANDCFCEVEAFQPLTVSAKAGVFPISKYKLSYYGAIDEKSQRDCRRECQTTAMKDYDAETLRNQLTPWIEQLQAGGMAGTSCSGPVDFKIPVRVKARIGDYSLGYAHRTMVFIHHEKSCI